MNFALITLFFLNRFITFWMSIAVWQNITGFNGDFSVFANIDDVPAF